MKEVLSSPKIFYIKQISKKKKGRKRGGKERRKFP
jgi:hypothetical protein